MFQATPPLLKRTANDYLASQSYTNEGLIKSIPQQTNTNKQAALPNIKM